MQTTDDNFIYWNKQDKDALLSEHFHQSEFNCQCDLESCVQQKVSRILLDRLEQMRNIISQPITIDSGYRCEAHQEELVNEKVNTVVATHSQHCEGDAADIKCPVSIIELTNAAKDAGFKAIGTSKSFLHVDCREAHPDGSLRLWNY